MTYLQMPAFEKTAEQLETHFDKWAYFLKNLEKFEDIPQILNEPIFTQAFQTAKVANFTKQERTDYEKSRLSYIGMKQVTLTAEADGIQKGREEEAGKAAKEKEDAILAFYDNGVPIPIIAKSFNNSEEEILEIITRHRI
jgi:predicted transposase/invertase (TIGR01784 family)